MKPKLNSQSNVGPIIRTQNDFVRILGLYKKTRRISIARVLLLAVLVFSAQAVDSHHSGSTHNPNATTRFVDPFTGKREKPAGYFVLTQDLYRGTNENSNLYTTTGFVEIPFAEGRFAFNLSVPWTYFDQKDRRDAARIGKTYLGGKWFPLGDFEKNYFLVVEGNVGFPSGPDTDRFTGGNYYTGQGFLTLGYLWNRWSFVAKGGGVQPLSRLQPNNLQDNDGIPYFLRAPSGSPPESRYLLKKTTLWQAYATYMALPEVSLFAGFLYRTPYQGVDFDREKEDTIPRIFREATGGFTYNFSEKYNVTVGYRYPLYRKKDHRLYESAWTIALSMEWDSN